MISSQVYTICCTVIEQELQWFYSLHWSKNHEYTQYLNCRRDASPHRELVSPHRELVSPHRELVSPHRDLASPHRDLASPHQDLGVPPSRFEHWMIRRKRSNFSLNFGKKPLQFSAKTFFLWFSPNFLEKTLQFSAKTFFFLVFI